MEVSEKLGKLLKKKRRKSHSAGGEEAASKLDRHLATSCRQFFSQKVEFHCVGSSDSHLEQLRAHYKPLNGILPCTPKRLKMDTGGGKNTEDNDSGGSTSHPDELPKPKRELFDSKNLVLGWKCRKAVGAGLGNLGNTCFLNSVLQCLLYTPPLYNYITSDDHKRKCEGSWQ